MFSGQQQQQQQIFRYIKPKYSHGLCYDNAFNVINNTFLRTQRVRNKQQQPKKNREIDKRSLKATHLCLWCTIVVEILLMF